MSLIKRRQFLQFSGSTLATLGLSQLDIQTAGDSFARVLAQGTPRKLALLVGINKYPEVPLRGCVTDVYLQKRLLMHRFGFNEKDILILTDEQATRQGILTAFEEHLIKQAKEGDVVVYHYSGHGAKVLDPECDVPPDCTTSVFLPVDSVFPDDISPPGSTVQAIMGHTLFLLMSALKTENVTVVLDSCYSGGGTRGNFRVRSRGGSSQLKAVATEQEYQQQWLSRLNLSPEEFKQRRRKGVAKGVVITSTNRNQEAADAPFNDFFAGAFTYLMTQYLWQQTSNESFSRSIPNIARSTTRLSFTGQEPLVEYKPGSDYTKNPVYFINEQTPPAEAVITKVEGTQADVWLGGLDPSSLAAFEKDSILSVVDAQGRELGAVMLESRKGLEGKAKLLNPVSPGALLQERTRNIPNNLTLKIGLDSSLGSDATAAKQALATIPRIETLPLQQAEVQYIFGRMTSTYRQQLLITQGTNLPEVGSLGLFSPGLELIPDAFDEKGENVSDAIARLRPKLQSLLAAYIVKTALNAKSSRLNVVASMRPEGAEQVIATSVTIRGRSPLSKVIPTNPSTPIVPPSSQKLPLGTAVQLQVANHEPSDLYVSVLVIDPTGEISVVFPNQWTAPGELTLVAANQTLTIPEPNKDNFVLKTQPPKGVSEVLILASRKPLRKALQTLRSVAGTQRGGPITLSDPGEVIDNLLDDINNASRGSLRNATPSNGTVRSLDTTQLAALSITFEVI